MSEKDEMSLLGAWSTKDNAKVADSRSNETQRTVWVVVLLALSVVGYAWKGSFMLGTIPIIVALLVGLVDQASKLVTKIVKTFVFLIVILLFGGLVFLVPLGFLIMLAIFIGGLYWIWVKK